MLSHDEETVTSKWYIQAVSATKTEKNYRNEAWREEMNAWPDRSSVSDKIIMESKVNPLIYKNVSVALYCLL